MSDELISRSKDDHKQGLAAAWRGVFIELHLHIDGSLSLESIRQLAALGNMELTESDEELLQRTRVHDGCSDLNEYLEKFDFPAQLLQTKEQLSFCVYELLCELKDLGYAYVELRFAPQRHLGSGLTQQEVVEAALDGRARFEQEQLKQATQGRTERLYSNLILCCMRGPSIEEANRETIRLAALYKNAGVCAVDLAGAEALFPTKDHLDLFAYAQELDLNITIHAGEADGPQSVWDALSLDVERIGHGVRSLEDPELIQVLRKRGVTLEVCPTSNINTGLYASYKATPIQELMDAGVALTINSDNMAVSNTSLERELDALLEAGSISQQDIYQLLLHAIDAAWCLPEIKQELKERLNYCRQELEAR